MPEFDPAICLGARSGPQIAEYLTKIKDLDGAAEFARAAAGGQSALWSSKAYTRTGLVMGYIPPTAGNSNGTLAVQGITSIKSDDGLIGKRIKITLDKVYVHEFPGRGKHQVLCEFAGKNQVSGETEELRFALRFEANDKDGAGVAGAPIFMGVTVGPDGISFEGRTVNVSSSDDEKILATLDSPAFKNGLALLNTAQPALKPFSSLAKAAVEGICSRSKNATVHCFNLGLDFAGGATSARLAYGSYVIVQTNETAFDWNRFVWNGDALALQPKNAQEAQIDFNYVIVAVTPFSPSEASTKPTKRAAKA